MFGFFKHQDPIQKFWNWFQANEKSLRDFQKDPDSALTQVLENLVKIREGLAVEFDLSQNGVIITTISADGDIVLFPVVQEVVARAPEIQGWAFVAFRQRIPEDRLKEISVKTEDCELNPVKMKFFPMIEGDSLDVIVYVNGVTEENYDQVAYAGLLLIDNILGEYDCVTKVRQYDFQTMPEEQEELEGLLPLPELAKYVDNFHRKK
ncbi:MAG: hypothetical protein KA165_05120 [Saprospiraceae bacterium]|nr:hypothetical protein [Saprospiraceae bacterium]